MASRDANALADSVMARPAQGPKVIPVKPKLRVSLVWLDVVGDVTCRVTTALTYRVMLSVVGAQLLPSLSLVKAIRLIPSLVVLAMHFLAALSSTVASFTIMETAAM